MPQPSQPIEVSLPHNSMPCRVSSVFCTTHPLGQVSASAEQPKKPPPPQFPTRNLSKRRTTPLQHLLHTDFAPSIQCPNPAHLYAQTCHRIKLPPALRLRHGTGSIHGTKQPRPVTTILDRSRASLPASHIRKKMRLSLRRQMNDRMRIFEC